MLPRTRSKSLNQSSNQSGASAPTQPKKGNTMKQVEFSATEVDLHEGLTKGEKLIEKINMVFMLLQAKRDDTAAAILQQVLDELKEIK